MAMEEADRIMFPKDVHIPVARTCEYAAFCGQRDCIDAPKLRVWRQEDHPDYPGAPRGAMKVSEGEDICLPHRKEEICAVCSY